MNIKNIHIKASDIGDITEKDYYELVAELDDRFSTISCTMNIIKGRLNVLMADYKKSDMKKEINMIIDELYANDPGSTEDEGISIEDIRPTIENIQDMLQKLLSK